MNRENENKNKPTPEKPGRLKRSMRSANSGNNGNNGETVQTMPQKSQKQKKPQKPRRGSHNAVGNNAAPTKSTQPHALRNTDNPKEIKVKDGKAKKNGKPPVKIIFLGGVGEIGKNMTAIECGDDIIIIDSGAIFPTDETPGFDLIVPDITYLVENAKKVRGLLLTHGHEDHIGSVPYLLRELKVPVIGTKLTLALVDNKLREHRITDVKEITVTPGQIAQLGCFKVRCINVNHSIAGSLAFAIQTPQGVIVHSGDYKIDLTPVAGDSIDLKTLSDLGASGTLLYLGESTNIERTGFTMSETVVGATLERLFTENAKRRLIIATFASNIYRIQQILDLAVKNKRKVALSGRSMLNVVDAAEKIGEIKMPPDLLVDINQIKNFRDNEIVVLSTGSQGEAMSALTRMANGTNNFVTIGENDLVIISAMPIPGNEKLVSRVINNLYRQGAEVIYEDVHVSGHACIEEHKIMHRLLRPKYFIPVHGEYRHLKKHAQLAEEMGLDRGKILIPDIGDCIYVTSDGIKRGESVSAGSRLIDGEGIEDEKASKVIEDRLQLSEEGLFIVSVAVSGGEVVGEPAINTRGFVFDFHRDYDKEIREVIRHAIDGYDLSKGTCDQLKRVIKNSLRNYLWKKTRQSPMVVPVIVEI